MAEFYDAKLHVVNAYYDGEGFPDPDKGKQIIDIDRQDIEVELAKPEEVIAQLAKSRPIWSSWVPCHAGESVPHWEKTHQRMYQSRIESWPSNMVRESSRDDGKEDFNTCTPCSWFMFSAAYTSRQQKRMVQMTNKLFKYFMVAVYILSCPSLAGDGFS